MKLPRDLSGSDLAKALSKLGYNITRQTGSHIRLSTQQNGEHHLTVPAHNPIKIGTLSAILREVEAHFEIDRETLLKTFF
jgi:predicted RNA binding protein YcfA (HicA-like mRNA interferase family)